MTSIPSGRRASTSELTHLIEGMADSLDESVTHEDVHRLLIEALELSMAQDAENARKPRTIESVEELEALPVGSVIVDRDLDAWQRYSTGWTCTDRAANTIDQPSVNLVNILGPATVVWEPGA